MLAGLLSELMQAVLHESLYEVLGTKSGVSMHGLDFEELLLNGYHSHIKRATTYVDDQYVSVVLVGVGVIDS